MNIRTLSLSLLVAAGSTHAQSLAPDSLICESDAELMFVREQSFLRGKPGSQVVDQAVKSAQIAGLKRQFATISPTRANLADAQAAEDRNGPMQRVANTCASSGPAPLGVQVVEAKAISAVSKVRVAFKGSTATLWVNSESLRE